MATAPAPQVVDLKAEAPQAVKEDQEQPKQEQPVSKQQQEEPSAAQPQAEGPSAAAGASKAVLAAQPDKEDENLLKHQAEALLSEDETSLSEDEALNMVGASSEAVEEEKRLHKERQEQEEAARAARSMLVTSELDSSRFSALNHLLKQSEVFSEFIADAVAKREEELFAGMRKQQNKASATAKGAKGGSKAGGSKTKQSKAGAGSKRGRKEEEEAAADEGAAAGEEDEGDGKRQKSTLTPTQAMLPELQNVELKAYQIKGVMWLISMYENGVNGILADQMGLGKTVQTIGFLSHLKKQGLRGPYIVIGPLSTLPNWMNEFERFLPTMPRLLYHGDKKEREELRRTRMKLDKNNNPGADFPVIITSYEIVIADAKYLANLRCKYLVVDEGHRLKNKDGKLIRELRSIPADNRLLLTGTPLQNNLSELWSLLNFLMPEVFKNAQDFEAWFDFSHAVGQEHAGQEIVAKEQRGQVVSKLHAILKPFMLRRLKQDSEVDIALPRKMEIVLYAPMTDTQRQINEQLKLKEDRVAQQNREAEEVPGGLLLQQEEEEGGGGGGASRTRSKVVKALAMESEGSEGGGLSLGRLNNVLMQLRKNCNHPDLITGPQNEVTLFPDADVLVQQCGKMQLLDRLLVKLRAKGHKVLIFSQMVHMLDLIDAYLDQKGHAARRLDGNVKVTVRQQNINAFNNKSDEDAWVFLLSTRAGGLGINLTAADTVIIYDSDWNPHQDMQAMDRCHRIGQQKPVLVFRLATSHSVEVKMLKRAADKMALERLVIRKDAFKGFGSSAEASAAKVQHKLSAEELMQLLRGDYRMESVPQSGMVSEETLDRLLDREHMLKDNNPLPYPSSGVGYEVVTTGCSNPELVGATDAAAAAPSAQQAK